MSRLPESKVVVYAFSCFDINVGENVVPPFKATADAIMHRFNGKAIPLTAETVDADELDGDGRWFRIPTGWGALR